MSIKFLTQLPSSRPSEATPWAKIRHTTYRSLRSALPFFVQLIILPNPPKSYAFQSARRPKSACSREGISTPCNVPWTHPTRHSKLPLDRFFCPAHGSESLNFTMRINAHDTRSRNRRQKTGVGFWRVCHTIWCQICLAQILESDRTCSISRQNLATT